ncbi:hypothetical protein GCM10025857_52800 [Alicyclobacillus contaminans]|nr:hypothetical protein GCM10025857_52800 [Alicyclobacillus contaminans]
MTGLQFPLKNDTSRKIIHIDMDAFFASVEERDDPNLAKHPLVIARHPKDTGGRGVVTTANYKARKYGIHSAMSAQKAYELCPHATFFQGITKNIELFPNKYEKFFIVTQILLSLCQLTRHIWT